MDDLDRALIEAWWRVWGRCVADPGEARRRWVRATSSRMLNAPSRAWCLGIRASDTRISAVYGVSEREAAREAHLVHLGVEDILEWCGPVRVPYPGVPIDVAADRLGRHVETVRRWLPMKRGRSREDRLNRQVTRDKDYPPPPPPEMAPEMAPELAPELALGMALGMAPEVGGRPPMASVGLYGAEGQPKRRRVRTSGGGGGWGVRYVPPKSVGRHQGAGVPIVWCDRPIDPGHQGGAPPIVWWGSMWERLAERFAEQWGERHTGIEVPESGGAEISGGDVLAAERVPRWIDRRRTAHGPPSREFRGWDWVCPGLAKCATKPRLASAVLENGERPPMTSAALYGEGCGRRAQVLVCPLPAWTIGDYLADRPEVAAGLDVGETTRWFPGRAGDGGRAKPRMGSADSAKAGRPPMASAALYGGDDLPGCAEAEIAGSEIPRAGSEIPGAGSEIPGAGVGFACVRCWGVRNVTQHGRGGWNEFVGRISGGLLFGGDVQRPAGMHDGDDAGEAQTQARAAGSCGVDARVDIGPEANA